MKKNLFLKAMAGMAAVAVLGVSSIIGASAARTTTISIDNVTAKAGDTVDVAVNIAGSPGFESMGSGKIKYDEGITLAKKHKSGDLAGSFLVTASEEETNVFVFSAASSPVDDTEEGSIVILSFTVPEDAEPGVYNISWVEETIGKYNVNGVSYADSITLANGSITVEGEPGTTPAVTEEVTEETTPVTEGESPKTGASTKGIAATSAVLLAAACSAVALKKKRD